MIGPHSKGRPDPRHASRRDAPLERSAEHVAHAAFSLQRKPVFVFHIAWSITASLRTTATRAFLNPQRFASRRPHAFSREKRTVLVSKSRRRLIQVRSRQLIAVFRDAPVPVDLAGLVVARREPEAAPALDERFDRAVIAPRPGAD